MISVSSETEKGGPSAALALNPVQGERGPVTLLTVGDPPRVVFFAPLNGGSLHGWLTGLAGMRDRFENVFLQ